MKDSKVYISYQFIHHMQGPY